MKTIGTIVLLFAVFVVSSPIVVLVDGFATPSKNLWSHQMRQSTSSAISSLDHTTTVFTRRQNIQRGASEQQEPVAEEKEEEEKNTSQIDSDPRKALEQIGSLFQQVVEIVTEGNTWDAVTLDKKTETFLRTYVNVFVPGMGYVITSTGLYLGTFALISTVLTVSGRGYNDLLAATVFFQPLQQFLQTHVDPTWGTIGISLVGLELLSPVILAVTLALTPQTMEKLQSKLNEWGYGEADLDARVAELLGKEDSATN